LFVGFVSISLSWARWRRALLLGRTYSLVEDPFVDETSDREPSLTYRGKGLIPCI